MSGAFSRDEIVTGYGIVPNGLWTLPVTAGARVTLGWLHSHSDQFLATLTVNKCRRMLGTSSVTKYMEELEDLGFVRIDRGEQGSAWKFHLLGPAWVALQDRAEVGSPEPRSAHPRAEVGAPKSARVEGTGLEQPDLEQLSPSTASTDRFPAFWARYPRKVGKPAARRAFKGAVKRSGLQPIQQGFLHWESFWKRHCTPEEFIPHPATWLNQERYNDSPPPTQTDAAALQTAKDLYAEYQAEEANNEEV